MTDKPHIVVVDDEADLRDSVEEYLTLRGFRVSKADGAAALRAVLARDRADVVLLDIAMPGEDGLTLARELRERGGVGIVMVTASGDLADRVVGLELGADDYVTKPFELRELLARVKSVLRRLRTTPTAGAVQPADKSVRLRMGRFTLDLGAHRLYDEQGLEVSLTAMEFDLLKAFVTHPNRVLNRDQLLDLAHDRDGDPFDRSVDVRVNRLRHKIEADPGHPKLITTVRGAGYMFVPLKEA